MANSSTATATIVDRQSQEQELQRLWVGTKLDIVLEQPGGCILEDKKSSLKANRMEDS